MKEPIYLAMANKITSMIGDDVYKAGDKLPSLRSLHRENGISIGTVLQAFNHLVNKGLIVSREKSGYFVSYGSGRKLASPQTIPASLSERTVRIDGLLQKLRADGTGRDFVSFANALPDHRLLPFNGIKRALQTVSRDISGSYLAIEERKGNLKLREEIAKRSFAWNGSLHADDLVITNGAMEAVILCLKAITKEGDTILVQDPCYYGIMQTLEYLNLKVVTVPCHSDTGIDVAVVEAACDKFDIKACVLVANFNNPDGACLNSGQKRRLAELANLRKLPVIEDDLYGDIFFRGNRPDTIKTYDKDGWVMYCNSFSKSLVPGFRIGWCAPGRFAYEVARLKSMHNGPVCNFTQRALHQLLASGLYDRHLKKYRVELQKNMLRTIHLIEKHFPGDTKISSPFGGLVIWAELSPEINTVNLQDEAFSQGISYAPGEIFSAKGDYKNYLRISFCRLWDTKTENALVRLGELFRLQAGKQRGHGQNKHL
ncbi:aminotransferase-like domain-containing protein [Mucilaginibacter ginsenosidivorans]|uniref:PLP-dependent aminotransferase family protein n=1 Tax=Mucilaginibacter ginsenosidivorans TaxID=398053 RepID=A0A5B8URM0_9SPHI|nr:PLP-dependent aminotransferase family protein [Mucilaginibacter ginsenosidivorans]QEC61365.1 PLP-dependent aminotransferase family protein [Mucilaginibacter ginsenosidivorans]